MKGQCKRLLENEISRRRFLRIAGVVAAGVSISGCTVSAVSGTPGVHMEKSVNSSPPSGGYLLVDEKKCQGCATCMLACSLVHHGKESLSLSRIQILQNPFEKYPDDISIDMCRQCKTPFCVSACPEGAFIVDRENGNIRRVDTQKCSGCMSCLDACPFESSSIVWNDKNKHAEKCDLCLSAPHWKEKGGVKGEQACVSLCPVGAISFSKRLPVRKGNPHYDVNLRGKNWKRLGFSVD